MKTNGMRLIVFCLAILMIFSLGACKGAGGQSDGTQQQQKPAKNTPSLEDFDPTRQYSEPDYDSLTWKNYVTLGRYSGLTLTLDADALAVDDAQVESVISEQILALPSSKVTDRPVAWGDTVLVDYVGTKDGVAFSGGTAYDQRIEVTSPNRFIPGFVEGMVGIVPGVPTDVSVTFPENYSTAALAGQDVIFTFTVSYIEQIPELTDELALTLSDGASSTVEEYRALVREQLEKQAYDQEVYTKLWSTIYENSAVKKYPDDAVMYVYSNMYQTYAYYAYSYGLNYETYLMYMGATPQKLFESCMIKVKQDMVNRALISAEGYTYTQKEYELALDSYTENMYESLNSAVISSGGGAITMEQARQYFDSYYRSEITTELLMQKATEDLLCDVNITIAQE